MIEAFIYDAIRTARGKGNRLGALYEVKPIDLLRIVLEAISERNQLSDVEVDDLVIGCATAVAEQGGNIARTSGLFANLNNSTSGISVNRLGISGLAAINLAAMKIRSGWEELIIAGGVESMSRVPIGTDLGPMFFDPVVSAKVGYIPLGVGADLMATKEGFLREDLDKYALLSQERARNAIQHNYFKNAIISVDDDSGMTILSDDENVSTNITLELLSELKSSYKELGETGYDAIAKMYYPQIEKINHLHTIGNSAKRADGAAVVLIGSKAVAKKIGQQPKAKILMAANAAVGATVSLESIILATQKALRLANLKVKDIDLWEVNEVFAAPVLKFSQHFNIPIENINVNGGAIAFGHPLGATGAMLVGKLIDELTRRKLKRGLVTLSSSGGVGCATIIEII